MRDDTSFAAGGIDAAQLRAFVERIERLEDDIKGLNDDKAEVYEEAAAEFDKAALKIVVRRRRKDRQSLDAEDFLVAQYERALAGFAGAGDQAPANSEAREHGRIDGLNDSRDRAHRWLPGEVGHADYELGYEDGRAARIDREAADTLPPAASRSRRRQRAEA